MAMKHLLALPLALPSRRGSEIAELLGAETASVAYSILGSFRFGGVMLKEIIPEARASAR